MNRTEQELDAELARMSEEVPPMPADFHVRWMNAVRNEQSLRNEAAKTDDTERKARQKTITLTRWTRILSAAAVFVFLIGGTVLYRNSKKTLNAAFRADEKAAVMMPAEVQAPEAPAAGAALTAAEQAITEAAPAAEAIMAEDAAADMDFSAGPAVMMNAAKSADTAPKAALYAAEEADTVSGAAEEEAEAETYEAADFTAMEAPVGTGLPKPAATALPAPTVTALPAEPAEEPEEHEEETGGFFQNTGVFLADMGDFLVAALPYLAVLAVPAVIAKVIRRKKRKTAG